MLSNRDWGRLIEGLLHATREGRLEWRGEGMDDAASVFSSLNSVSTYARALAAAVGRTALTAATSGATYEVSAASGGLAPYVLKVWERDGSGEKEVGSIESSVRPIAMTSGLNDSLKGLWTAAAATVESGTVIVDRLLGEL